MSRRLGLGGKLALGCASLAAALLAAELGLRLLHPVEYMKPMPPPHEARAQWSESIHRPSATPGLTYELAANVDQPSLKVRVTTNSLGMRDDEPRARSTPGLFRILAVGDSVTFGFGVEGPETFANVLERLLADSPLARDRTFEVLNVGVSGYSTRDELAALEGKWLALEPDLVVIGYCINDPEIFPRQPLQRAFVPTAWWQHSDLARLIAHRWQIQRIRSLGRGNYARFLHAVDEEPWQSVVAAFRRFGELARERHFPVVLAIFPQFALRPWKAYPIRDVHAQVAAEGARNGFVVLDLLPRYERESPASLLFDPLDSHPSVLGHRIAAEELLRVIAESSALQASAR